VVQRDALQLLGVRGWRRRAENMDEWRRALREAKTRKGLKRHTWMEDYKGLISTSVGTLCATNVQYLRFSKS
jgi:hypothetical protein